MWDTPWNAWHFLHPLLPQSFPRSVLKLPNFASSGHARGGEGMQLPKWDVCNLLDCFGGGTKPKVVRNKILFGDVLWANWNGLSHLLNEFISSKVTKWDKENSLITDSINQPRPFLMKKKTILVVVCWCISPFKFPHLSARCDSSANSTDTSILTESTLNPSSLFAYFISPALQKKL